MYVMTVCGGRVNVIGNKGQHHKPDRITHSDMTPMYSDFARS